MRDVGLTRETDSIDFGKDLAGYNDSGAEEADEIISNSLYCEKLKQHFRRCPNAGRICMCMYSFTQPKSLCITCRHKRPW